MSGMIGVGNSYKNKAMSGFVRQTAEQHRINEANADLMQQTREEDMQFGQAVISVGMLLAKVMGGSGGSVNGGTSGMSTSSSSS